MKDTQIHCKFTTKTGKNFLLRIPDAKGDLDGETVTQAMKDLVASQIFGKEDPLQVAQNAYLVETEKTLII